MKKTALIVAAVAAVAGVVLLLLPSAQALAQPPAPQAGARGMMVGVTIRQVANLLGMTPQEIVTQLREGKTLADIATSKGVGQDKLIDTILAPHADMLQLRVKYGNLTQAEADAALQRAREWVSTAITKPNLGRDGDGNLDCPGHEGAGQGGMMGRGGMTGADMMGGARGMMGGGTGMMGGGAMGRGMMGW